MKHSNSEPSNLLALQLHSNEFAKFYFNYCLQQEGLDLEEALRESIRSMGVRVFSCIADMDLSSVSDFAHRRSAWSSSQIRSVSEKVFDLRIH